MPLAPIPASLDGDIVGLAETPDAEAAELATPAVEIVTMPVLDVMADEGPEAELPISPPDGDEVACAAAEVA